MARRIQKSNKAEGLHITIKPYVDTAKQKMLTVWLLAWTLCGLAIISQIFVPQSEDVKIVIVLFTAFWAYFEYMVVKAFRWRRSGEEQFLITENEIKYGRTYNNRGFLKPYRKDLVNKVRLIDGEINTFTKVFYESYWVVGGERLAFTVGSKVVPFGLRLTDKEVAQLKKMINSAID